MTELTRKETLLLKEIKDRPFDEISAYTLRDKALGRKLASLSRKGAISYDKIITYDRFNFPYYRYDIRLKRVI